MRMELLTLTQEIISTRYSILLWLTNLNTACGILFYLFLVVKWELTRNLLGVEKWQKTEAVGLGKGLALKNHCLKVVSRNTNEGSVEREF